MRKTWLLLTLMILPLLIPATASADEMQWLMHGTITWSSGTAAASIKMRLLQNKQEKSITYTNQEGAYGFFDIPGRPSDYALEMWFGARLLRTVNPEELQQIPRGGRFDIKLPRS